ncbi:hypothetical protein DICVIV_09097 [Dictyocaulus viviparus]|uniref:Uncharacterized protein n=1 Tax=Dictyocaulus viviparus TaxID=29172 RepID=A0A0D8XJV7_DICVI|nr:hypothetical protein DICVIV_09097 [Dictyocaulus viviparus]
MSSMSITGKRVLTVVSGASRGIGKEIALQMSRRVSSNSVFLLTARTETSLLQIKQDILNSHHTERSGSGLLRKNH